MKQLDRKLIKCKSKALEHYRTKDGVKVNWSDSNERMFADLFDLFFAEVTRQFYIKLDGRRKSVVEYETAE